MLCRALLAIIVLSCTFSREIKHVHGQGTQRIVQIKDLICVLILSGLQKEDLDVNMLKKLERHGLNTDDMNNESLRQNCFKNTVTDKYEYITTEVTSMPSTTEKVLKQDGSNIKETNKTELNEVIKYFMDLKKIEDKSTTKSYEDVTSKNIVFENYDIPESSNLKYVFSDLIGYKRPQLIKNNLHTSTTDRAFQLFSQNILKLWNTYGKQDVKDFPTSEPTTLRTSSSDPIKNTSNHEIDIMKKMISDYISKSQKIHTTTQSPPRMELDIDRISEEIRRFLANAQSANENKLGNNIKKTENNMNNPQINVYTNISKDNIGKGPKKVFDQRLTLGELSFVTKLYENKSNPIIDDEIRLDKTEDYHNSTQTNNEMSYHNDHGIPNGKLENYKLIMDDSMLRTINNLYTNMSKGNKQNVKYEQSLSKDIINEIAESVKAIVLNDLKKEISSINMKSTSTTTEMTSTTNSKHDYDKGNEATHMMEKFMEMFQQFKSTKEKTIISGNSQMKVTEKKDIKHEYKGPVKLMYTPSKPAIIPYGARPPTEQFAPIFVDPNNHVPYMNAPQYNVIPNMMNPVYQVRQIDNFHVKSGLRLAPITIQTNSFEVPPLGIPIAKPLLVNQNIIVTTKSPNLRPKLDTHHTNYIPHVDRYNIDDDFLSRNNWQKSLTNSNPELQSRTRNGGYTVKNYDNIKIKINDRSNYENRNAGDYEREYKPHFTKSDYDRMKLRNQEIKRFHERLENFDEPKNSGEKEDCCKIRVASRQQLPLANAKKRSRYDDVHFRNFLKTQQKVNDMLEKILASKTKADGPRSVETT